MDSWRRSRVGILGTLSEFHLQPIDYDLECLRRLVVDLAPDLLCAEITREVWERGDLSQAALEVREALAPVVALTDTVLVPVAASWERFEDLVPAEGWRRKAVAVFDRALRQAQRAANRPQAVNSALFENICHTVCALTELAWTPRERALWDAQNAVMAENICQAVRNDPGRRVLVAVQCQRVHKLEPLLKRQRKILELVNYWEL